MSDSNAPTPLGYGQSATESQPPMPSMAAQGRVLEWYFELRNEWDASPKTSSDMAHHISRMQLCKATSRATLDQWWEATPPEQRAELLSEYPGLFDEYRAVAVAPVVYPPINTDYPAFSLEEDEVGAPLDE